MCELKRLPDAELEVMMIIWEAEGTVTSDYIMDRIDKDWAKTTLLNLLIRLCDRGFVKCDKVGKHNTYTAIVEYNGITKTETVAVSASNTPIMLFVLMFLLFPTCKYILFSDRIRSFL